jgi:hypothetical protein
MGLPLEERDPVRVSGLAHPTVSDEGLLVGQGQHVADEDLRLVPLEDQDAIGAEHTEALGEPAGQVLAPGGDVEAAVLLEHPPVATDAGQVRAGRR